MKQIQTIRKTSPTLRQIGGVKTLRSLPRKDRAFLLAKICSEKGKLASTRAAAKVSVDSHIEEGEYGPALEVAREHGDTEQINKAVIKIAKNYMNLHDHKGAKKLATEHGLSEQLKDLVSEDVACYVRKASYHFALNLIREYGLYGDRIKESASKLVEHTLQYEQDVKAVHEMGKEFGLTEEGIKKAVAGGLEVLLYELADGPKICNEGSIGQQVSPEGKVIWLPRSEHYAKIFFGSLESQKAKEYIQKERDKLAAENASLQKKYQDSQEYVLKVFGEFGFTEGQIQELGLNTLTLAMIGGWECRVQNLSARFGFTEGQIKEAAARAADICKCEGDYSDATKIAKEYGLVEQLGALEKLQELFSQINR